MNGHISSEMGALAVAGIVIVFSVLALMSVVVAIFKKLDDRWQAAEAAQNDRAGELPPTIDTTTLLLISAACATVVGGRFRVRRIRRLLSPRQKRTPWSAQGRLTLQGSHTLGSNHKHR